MSTPGASRQQTNRQQQQQSSSAIAARSHPLYPILDASSKNAYQACQGVGKLELSVGQLRNEVKILQTAVQELRELVKKQNRIAFSLKNEGYEVCPM